ncbi:MAG TPA: acyl carrier protein [Pseudoxanthomonas sp.]|nr:acyl carrier protein [Pseudoxanthomonas sp.]
MQRDDIFGTIKLLIAERFDVPADSLSLETTQQDLRIDSILMVDLMMDVEERLDFTFDSLELPKNPSLGAIVDLVDDNLKKQPAP